jgi:ABC-type glycerol-3-phosphate transport system substrate-binding protein
MNTLRRAALLRHASVGVSGLLLAACGAAGQRTAEPAQEAKRPITLQFMTQGANPPNEWDSLLAYSRKAPHVTVALDVAGGGDDFTQKGLALAAGGTPPHVTWCSTRFGIPFVSRNLLADVQEHVARSKMDVRDIPKPVYEETLNKGKLSQLTTDVGYAMLAYNKSAFASAGRPDPWQAFSAKQWDWNHFVSEAQAISGALGGASAGGYAVVVSTWDGEFFTVVRSNGGDVLDKDQRKLMLDQPQAIEALEAWSSLVQRFQVAPPLGAAGQTFASGKVPMEFFAQARIGRTRMAAAQAGYQWDLVATPAPKDSVPTMFTNGLQLWKGKDEKEAWDFIAHSMTTEVLLERGRITGRVPSRLSLLEGFAKTLDVPAQDPKSFVKLYPELAKNGRGLPSTANFTIWRDIVEKEVLQPILKGDRSVRDAVQRATPLVNAELAKNPV